MNDCFDPSTSKTGRGEAWLDATLRGRKGGAAGQRQEPPFDDKPGQSFSKSRRSFSTRFWAGYITLFGTTMVTHPLDTLRVRLSVHSDAAVRFEVGSSSSSISSSSNEVIF
jgi:hypothetical protein